MTAHRREPQPNPAIHCPAHGLPTTQRTADQGIAASDRNARLIARVGGGAVAASGAPRCFSYSRGTNPYPSWPASSSGTDERNFGDVIDCPRQRHGAARRLAGHALQARPQTSPSHTCALTHA